MKIVRATIVCAETHRLEIEVPNDTSHEDCEKMIWDEYSKSKPTESDTELADFEVTGVIR